VAGMANGDGSATLTLGLVLLSLITRRVVLPTSLPSLRLGILFTGIRVPDLGVPDSGTRSTVFGQKGLFDRFSTSTPSPFDGLMLEEACIAVTQRTIPKRIVKMESNLQG
jgi:hypothetical protein